MLINPSDGCKNYIQLVFCRKDFIPVISSAAVIGDEHDGYVNISYEKARKMASPEEIIENISLSNAASECTTLSKMSVNRITFLSTGDDQELTSLANISELDSRKQAAMAYLFDKTNASLLSDTDYGANPVDEAYKLSVKGNTLFVGIEPGFVILMDNFQFCRQFLINSLEMCRTAMQSPALVESHLYRRFISLNL